VSEHTISYKPASNLLVYDRWLQEIGRTPATGWRYRRRHWISTINIAGRLYITRDEVARFEARAAAGEFSKDHKTPKRKGAKE
jgi:hypothetical protein